MRITPELFEVDAGCAPRLAPDILRMFSVAAAKSSEHDAAEFRSEALKP
jgi:hypothetical protein